MLAYAGDVFTRLTANGETLVLMIDHPDFEAQGGGLSCVENKKIMHKGL
jgi:hypothetical protein